MNNTTARLRLVQALLELDKRKPVEAQLRNKWLQELKQLQLSKCASNKDVGSKI